MSKFKVGDRVRIREDAKDVAVRNIGWVYEMDKTIGKTGIVNILERDDSYDVIVGNESWSYMANQLELVPEEPKYPIIEMLHGDKIVFNPPYTIVTCNLTHGKFKGQKLVGKAKCNPLDTYDKWTGFKIAHDRMAKATPCLK